MVWEAVFVSRNGETLARQLSHDIERNTAALDGYYTSNHIQVIHLSTLLPPQNNPANIIAAPVIPQTNTPGAVGTTPELDDPVRAMEPWVAFLVFKQLSEVTESNDSFLGDCMRRIGQIREVAFS